MGSAEEVDQMAAAALSTSLAVAGPAPDEKEVGMEGTMNSELTAFMHVMESRLKENAGRGDWKTLNFYYLTACLAANLGQMIRAFQANKPDLVLRSAADTANYAVMIADLYGELMAKKR